MQMYVGNSHQFKIMWYKLSGVLRQVFLCPRTRIKGIYLYYKHGPVHADGC